MELSLTQSSLFFGLLLLAAGGSLLLKYSSAAAMARNFPRSEQAGKVLMILAMAWTGWKVWHLGSMDYGDYKQYILIGFGILGVLSFKYAADFLSVRASCILYLFFADMLVDSAWMRYEEPLRLLMVVPVYIGIALSLYLAYAPFRLRDFFGWAFAQESRGKSLAMVAAVYGLLLSGVAFTF
ncbi:hypothetical protein IEN85_14855 [Pelagicoccus sp. NFK12]|uniref:Uncharacterized protein n=1 Tax=Pelagicoccus enzymogenes TaxID=2773457 RepID=A0A927IG39_9BACT|nr:hypothetical protein [Pelagicoccus enzymogenes]MBD5780777.1 hypothetical protein [Pelagicoccus enzymogenes]MDQ8200455.1 hypothetical protein [Pelagicoccus enzymogenes]